jgi:hypothetical protein
MDMNDSTPAAAPAPAIIEVPAPTAWPLSAAFGVTLIFAGLATSEVITGIGVLLAIAGVVGWFRQIFPHEVEEAVPVLPEVVEVATTRRTIESVPLAAMNLVRAQLPLELYPMSAGIRGGLAGGVAMAFLAILYGVVSGHGVWYPINLLSAGVFPGATIEQLTAFYPAAFGVSILIHVIVSTLVGLLYGALLPMLPRRPILLGGLIAPVLWSALIYSFLALINPTLAERIDWIWFVISQIGFGIVAGLVVSRRERIAMLQQIPMEIRAGMEATGLREPQKGQDDE